MAYRSLFQPISEAAKMEYQRNHSVNEGEFYDPRALFEDAAQPVAAPVQQPAVQPQAPVQQQQAAPVAQPQQPAAPVQQQPAAQPQCLMPQQITGSATWQAYTANPSVQTLQAFYNSLTKAVQKYLTPQGQQPAAQPQAPVQQQPAAQPQQQVAESVDYFGQIFDQAINESENDGSDDDDAPSTKSSGSKSSSDFDDTKDVKYASQYKKDDGGSPSDFGWDKQMRAEIFGGKDDFSKNSEVKYDSAYGKGIEKGDAEGEVWNINPTKPEPYKPEKPSFTSLSNPSALSKTVFTSGKVEIKDAPTVATPAPAAGGETNEGFRTNYDNILKESLIDENLKRVIVQEFLNFSKGAFDLAEFNDWLIDNYPQIARDPNIFDEVSTDVENSANSGDFDEGAEPDTSVDGDEVVVELTVQDLVDEYMAQYTGEEYDEDDASDWLDDNYDIDSESREDFLDLVADQFKEDDINESFDDEFFENEPNLNS